MKKIFSLALCTLLLVFTACEYDNYDAPSSRFHGQILYKGEPLGFDYNEVYIELWELGDWDLKEAIRVNVNIDGTFSQVLFDGDYKMVIPKQVRPFVMEQDTVLVQIRGNKEMNIEVTPYYTIEDVKYNYNAETDKLECTCAVRQQVTDPELAKEVDIIRVYVGKTAYLSHQSYINYHTLNTSNNPGGSLENVVFSGPAVNSANLLASQNYIFGRVAVQVKGSSIKLMTLPKKITFR